MSGFSNIRELPLWDVTSWSNLTDNAIVRWDWWAKLIQTSWVLIDDSDNITWVVNLTNTGKIGVWIAPLTNQAVRDIALEWWSLILKEITTPTADANYWKVYTKTDNELYFQDWGGTENMVNFANLPWTYIYLLKNMGKFRNI